MPEGLEVELYRRVAERAVGRPISAVSVDDRQAMARELEAVLPGRTIAAAHRRGKLLVLELVAATGAPTSSIGLHFGMTGRLVVDGRSPIDALQYGPGRDDPSWDRLTVTFVDGGVMRVNDPRRWARFVPDPTAERLGPDFLTVTAAQLLPAFARRGSPVKTALMDQYLVAGYGNMCVDEVLWQVGIDPFSPARELPHGAVERLVAFAPRHLRAMLRRGGSHRGTISPDVRSRVPACPRDGAPMRRDTIGGRTTVWCPVHQRRI
jgi:formamidopyrimidine-DNA glycosylase